MRVKNKNFFEEKLFGSSISGFPNWYAIENSVAGILVESVPEISCAVNSPKELFWV